MANKDILCREQQFPSEHYLCYTGLRNTLRWNETCEEFIRRSTQRETRAGGGWESQQRQCSLTLEESERGLGGGVQEYHAA